MRTPRFLNLALFAVLLTASGACSVQAADPEKTAPTITASCAPRAPPT